MSPCHATGRSKKRCLPLCDLAQLDLTANGHQRTVAVTFELVALSDAERPVFGEQFEGGNFENRPEAEIRADLEIRGHQSDF